MTKPTPEQITSAKARRSASEDKIAKFRSIHEAHGIPVSGELIAQFCIVEPFDLRTKGTTEAVQEDEL